jgi:hypothetical protein
LGTWLITDRGRFQSVQWKGDIARALESWLEEVDRRDDVALFRRLFEWKPSTTAGWRRDAKRLRAFLSDLLARFLAAGTPAVRQIVLQKFDLWFTLNFEHQDGGKRRPRRGNRCGAPGTETGALVVVCRYSRQKCFVVSP